MQDTSLATDRWRPSFNEDGWLQHDAIVIADAIDVFACNLSPQSEEYMTLQAAATTLAELFKKLGIKPPRKR